jgi:hypothetical protein
MKVDFVGYLMIYDMVEFIANESLKGVRFAMSLLHMHTHHLVLFLLAGK